MGVHVGVPCISFDISDDAGQQPEDNARNERTGAQTAGPAAHDSFGGDDADVMPAEVWLTEFGEDESHGCQTEDDDVVGAKLQGVSLQGERNINAGYGQRAGEGEQESD